MVVAVPPAVDAVAHRVDVALIGVEVQVTGPAVKPPPIIAADLPVPPCRSKAVLDLLRAQWMGTAYEGRVVYQIQPEVLTTSPMVAPTGYLYGSVAFILRAVAFVDVPEVLSPLVSPTVGKFLPVDKFARLRSELGEEARHPKLRRDLKLLAGCNEVGQVNLGLLLRDRVGVRVYRYDVISGEGASHD